MCRAGGRRRRGTRGTSARYRSEVLPIVTLLTDFGQTDTYVGQVKAAILSVAPEARLVDLTHAVPPQDVETGAFLLWSAVEVFPAGTVHLAVVDPGVGSARRAVAVQAARGDYFVGPDNGLLGPAIGHLGGLAAAVELTNATYWRSEPSATFHGRDIFGPAAGHLAAGVAIEELGRHVPHLAKQVHFPEPRRSGAGFVGTVLHVDSFGNLTTNLPAGMLPTHYTVTIRGRVVQGAPHASYRALRPGDLLALVGSTGLLEVSARDGSAAALLQAGRGDQVLVDAR